MIFLSVRTKILASLILVTLSFGIGMVLFTGTVIYHKLDDKLGEKGLSIARDVAMDCVSPILTERFFEISMRFKELKASDQDIVYAYMLDNSGRVIAHSFEKGVSPALKRAHVADVTRPFSVKELETDRGGVHDIAVPILSGEVGVLHLGLSEDAIAADVNEIVKVILLFALAVLVTGVLVSFWVARTVTRPLLRLAEAAEAFGRGETNYVLPVESKDEVGELSRIFSTMIERRMQADSEREKLISELQEAMGKIKTLSGMLPICSHCKKIRDDKGYWKQLEVYIRDHSEAEFSHGICPECLEQHYAGLLERMKKGKENGS